MFCHEGALLGAPFLCLRAIFGSGTVYCELQKTQPHPQARFWGRCVEMYVRADPIVLYTDAVCK
jgi:hypothetical protein